MYISSLSDNRHIRFTFNDIGFNEKTVELIEKYKSGFIRMDNGGNLRFIPNAQLMNSMLFNTNLKEYRNE